jgi:DNA-binding transcriptional ArsR family regulator
VPIGLDTSLQVLGEILEEYAPEISEQWLARLDDAEEDGVRMGRMHENHILGIVLGYDLADYRTITTSEIEEEYEALFKKIARSTVSTYLNQLNREAVLRKIRDGRVVYYQLKQPVPAGIEPFWIVRNICLMPPYLIRARLLAQLYREEVALPEEFVEGRKFVVGLALLVVLKNRHERCSVCQFGNRQTYREIVDTFQTNINSRKDVLPEPLQHFIEVELGELPLFGGLDIPAAVTLEALSAQINDLVDRYIQDIEFQINVSRRRNELRFRSRSGQRN